MQDLDSFNIKKICCSQYLEGVCKPLESSVILNIRLIQLGHPNLLPTNTVLFRWGNRYPSHLLRNVGLLRLFPRINSDIGVRSVA